MKKKLIRIVSEIRRFKSESLDVSDREKQLMQDIQVKRGVNHNEKPKGKKVLLLPFINQKETMLTIFHFSNLISKEYDLKVKYFYVNTAIDENSGDAGRLLHRFYLFQNMNSFKLKKLAKIYGIRKKDIIFSNFFYTPLYTKEFSDKKEILSYSNGGMGIGELIYDTYLRFRDKPTPDLFDKDLGLIATYGFILVDKWRKFLKRNRNITHMLLPYASYLHWGVPARTAMEQSLEVLTFGSPFYILSKSTKDYPYHSKNFHKYRPIWDTLDKKEEKLGLAQLKLDSRLNGIQDAGTAYMKESAFQTKVEKSDFRREEGNWAIIFLHCFFDSPHDYGDGLFTDFYEWIVHLLELASKNRSVEYVIKPHPNGLEGNDRIIAELKTKFKRFDNLNFISSSISNIALVQQKPQAIFSYYGTVGHEFAHLGLPVIMAGENPHNDYGFLYQPKTLTEYEWYIQNIGKFGLPSTFSKNEVLEFYYMHYCFFSAKFDQVVDRDLNQEIENGRVLNVSVEEMIFD